MEQASIDESPLKTSSTKEKSKKAKSETSVSLRLGTEAVLHVPEKPKEKTLGSLLSLDNWRRPEKETPLKPDKEETKIEPGLAPSELIKPTETEVNKDLAEPELHLGSADEAWQRVDPDRKITEVEQSKAVPLEDLPATASQLNEVEPIVDEQVEAPTEELANRAEAPEVSIESLLSVADHEIHDLPLKSSELQARPELAPDIMFIQPKAINELPSPDSQPEEIAAEPEQPAQLTYEEVADIPQPVAETAAGSGNNFEPPLPPEASESAPPPDEPERSRQSIVADPTETLIEDQPWVADDESVRQHQAETVVTALELPPERTVIERHIVEHRSGLPSLIESISLFGLDSQHRRMEKELRRVHRHEHKQKRQTERFVAQQARANERLSRQLTQHQTESRRQETTLKRQFKTVNQLLSEPKRIYERVAQPLRQKVKVGPRSMERITSPLLKPKKANKSPERPATVVNLSPKVREIAPAVAVKYASALEKTAIRLSSKPARLPSLYELPTPVVERPETDFRFTASTKPESSTEQQVKSIVADTAIEQVIQLPQGHHLEQSAWHSIEVDNTGKAVEHPVFNYGQEFTHEQHQEAQQQVNLPQWAAAAASLATTAGGYSSPTTNSTSQSLIPTLPPKAIKPPTIKFENTIREHTQFKLSTADPYTLFLVVLGVVFLAIAGLIVIH